MDELTDSTQVLLTVPRVTQSSNWDCGLACVRMILNYFKVPKELEEVKSLCKDLGVAESVWTIDLCHLLWHCGIRIRYSTITIGVDPGLSDSTFYQDGNAIENDSDRVNELFRKAGGLGLQVTKRDVPLAELLDHIAQTSRPVLVLVDAACLTCISCSAKEHLQWQPSLKHPPTDFQGHYVLLVGFRRSGKSVVVFYQNPSNIAEGHVCCVTAEEMEVARHCYGTDVDTIFTEGLLRQDTCTLPSYGQ